MIPEKNANKVVSTVEGSEVAMTIDQSALAHIMNVLTDLYSDPELAVIREYSTNAYDSHIEAGQTRPIEVALPTELRPMLTVRDFGVGLDGTDIENIYSRYGASTKRDTNDAVGMLGLGCKSALAYVDQFTLVGIKDGQRIAVSVSRDETGAGVMTVLENGETTEHNGVEVIVPAKRGNLMDFKAREFFAHWEPGTVLVNGKQPEPIEGWQIDDEFMIADRESYERKLYVVMGNVSYPVSYEYEAESEALRSLPDGSKIIARVPIGMVSFTPSRESLQDHPATKAALDQILATFATACERAIKTQVAGAEDKPSAAKALIEARAALGPKNVPSALYGGEAIPIVISAEDLEAGRKLWRNSPVRGHHGSVSSREPARQVSLDDAGECPWIVGFTNKTWSSTMRRKLNRYMEHHNLAEEPAKRVIFITDAAAVPKPDWIDGAVTAIQWKDVRDWKDPLGRQEGGSGGIKYAGTYATFHEGRLRLAYEADDLPKQGRGLYYVERTLKDAAISVGAQCCGLLGPNAHTVCVPSHRAAKFKRMFPHARPAETAAKAAAEGWWNSLTADQRTACRLLPEINHHTQRLMHYLSQNQVKDKQLSNFIRIYQKYCKNEKLTVRFRQAKIFLTLPEDNSPLENLESVLSTYPLLNGSLYATPTKESIKHMVIYINAVHAARAKESK